MLKKAIAAMKELRIEILVGTQQVEKRAATGLLSPENAWMIINRTLLEIWMVKPFWWGPRWKQGACHWTMEKSDPCYQMENNVAELYSHSSVLWKVLLGSNDTGLEEQSVGGAAWFLLTASGKMWEERNELRKKLLSKKSQNLRFGKVPYSRECQERGWMVIC